MRIKIAAVVTILIIVCIPLIGCDGFSFVPVETPARSERPAEPTLTTQPPQEPVRGELKVHFIDVGQGDAILIDLGDTEVLIDGGDRSPGITEYIQAFVDGPIEVMVATHPHADHIGGLIAVLEAYDVASVWLNGESATSKTYADFMAGVNGEGAQVHEARLGQVIQAGDLTFHVLHPTQPFFEGANNDSIVLSMAYGEIDFLFMGDAEIEAERSIMVQSIVQIPDVEIMKVGHHGSRTASSLAFLNIARPDVAIYQAGADNRYGHPHAEAIAALEAVGARIYGTESYGTIVVTTNGVEYKLDFQTTP